MPTSKDCNRAAMLEKRMKYYSAIKKQRSLQHYCPVSALKQLSHEKNVLHQQKACAALIAKLVKENPDFAKTASSYYVMVGLRKSLRKMDDVLLKVLSEVEK